MSAEIMLTGATVIDTYTGVKGIRDILTQGDRITQVVMPGTLTAPPNTKVIDAKGTYAIPGLWDMLCHAVTYPQLAERLPALLVAQGVTSIRMIGEPLDKTLMLRDISEQAGAIAPRLWFSGPYINSSPPWGSAKSLTADTPEEAYALVDELVDAGVHMIKTYEMLKPEVFAAIVQRADHHGLRTGGHVPTRMTIEDVLKVAPHYEILHLGGQCTGMKFDCTKDADLWRDRRVSALDANQTSMDAGWKLLEAMEKVVSLSLSDLDSENRDRLIQCFVSNGTWHTPTLMAIASIDDLGLSEDLERQHSVNYLPQDLLRELIDTYGLPGESDVEKSRQQWGPWFMETVGLMHKAGVRLMAGTDYPPYIELCAPGLALHFELSTFAKVGLSPLAALQTATLNPAKYFEIEHDFGSIAAGRYADIVLLDADPLEDINNTRRIAAVISRGRHLDRQKLDQLLDDMIEQ
ncbi:amidohydrolase family protein [SAR92 clade bacterium H231]|nr:amidohydrolase family protein [SAR92 clade bacterium H231]